MYYASVVAPQGVRDLSAGRPSHDFPWYPGQFPGYAANLSPEYLCYNSKPAFGINQHAGHPILVCPHLIGPFSGTNLHSALPDMVGGYIQSPEAPSLIAIPIPPASDTTGLTEPDGGRICDFPGCAKPFTRQSDLRRHLQIHYGQARHCPVQGCTKSFRRRDKVKDHLMAGHKLGKKQANELSNVWKLSGNPTAPAVNF